MTGALKTRNACTVNAISQTCHQKKCLIIFSWGYVLPSNFNPDDETAKKNSSEEKGNIIVAKLHFLFGFRLANKQNLLKTIHINSMNSAVPLQSKALGIISCW